MPDCVGAFLSGCRLQLDGFVAAQENSSWRLGGVLLVRSGTRMAVVRKAAADGGRYEFSGMRSFPGGMVRSANLPVTDGADVERLLFAAIRNRTLRETSLELSDKASFGICPFGPVVTSYFAKGEQRYTVVVAASCDVATEEPLHADDPSVDSADWTDVVPKLSSFAPANCVVAAHLLWDRLGDEERALMTPVIQAAVDHCGRWAREIAFPAVVPPWADDQTLARWRCGWPM